MTELNFYKVSLLSKNISKVTQKTVLNIEKLQKTFQVSSDKVKSILDKHSLALYYLSRKYLSEDFKNVVSFFCEEKKQFIINSKAALEDLELGSNFDENYINYTKSLDNLFNKYIKSISNRFNLDVSFYGLVHYNEFSKEYIPITSKSSRLIHIFRDIDRVKKAQIKDNKLIVPIFRHYSDTPISYFVINIENPSIDYHKVLAALNLGFFSIERKIKEIISGTIERIATKGIKDELTDVYKRWYGTFKIKESLFSLEKEETALIFMVDVDHFKGINDQLGHAEGDKVLIQIANVLKSVFRENEDIILRFGGDEFVVCIVQNDKKPINLNDVKYRLLTGIEKVKNLSNDTAYKDLGFSVGVERYSSETTVNISKIYEDLIKKADKKLYEAKKIKQQNQVIIID